MIRRPYVNIKQYTWLGPDGVRTPGIAIVNKGNILAHYTIDEARTAADKIHDLADKLEGTSHAES